MRRRRDQETWQHKTTLKSRAQVSGCARSVGCTPLLGGRVNGTPPAWRRRPHTRARAERRTHGRSGPPGTPPPGTTGRDWYGRARTSQASGVSGHHGRVAPAGTPRAGTTSRERYGRARASHRHHGLTLAGVRRAGTPKLRARARRVPQIDGTEPPNASVSRAAGRCDQEKWRQERALKSRAQVGAAPAASVARVVGPLNNV